MRARNCGHTDCLEQLEAALARRKREMLQSASPGEPMSTVRSSCGEFQIPRRLADADIALDRVMMCSK
jgi:hypothetical protein